MTATSLFRWHREAGRRGGTCCSAQPTDPFAQRRHVEVDEQCDLQTRDAQVGNDLRLVDRLQFGNSFQLDDQGVLNEQVDSVVAVERRALVADSDRELPRVSDVPEFELTTEARFVSALEKPWSEVPMHLDAGADHLFGETPQILPPRLPVSLCHRISYRHERPNGCERGFTLLEVMVALAILGLALTAILSAQAGLYGANVQARNLTQATSAARCKMNELEVELLSKGYPEADQNEDGPCCAGDSPPGMTCKWSVERVTLPDPPKSDLTADGGVGGGGDGGLGPLGALAGAAANPGALGDGGLSALTSTLATPVGPGGQTGVAGVAGLAMNIVYPQLKPLLEASIRRVTLDVVWNEGPVERKLRLVQFITNPNKGLPPMMDPSMAGAMGMPGAVGPGGVAPTPTPAATGISAPGLPR